MSKKKTSQIFSGRYEIVDHLGEGGIGKVYKANDRWIHKEVALKTLSSENLTPGIFRDFENEFLLLSQLRHPGVVEVLDFGHSEETWSSGEPIPYFTMEFVEGGSLERMGTGLHDSTEAREGYEKLNHLIWQICDILEFLHFRGIVHCDLKPDNIKITGRTFCPKILDFGLYEKLGSRKNREAKGTLPYMAPEMFKQEPLDERTDLYSLGVVLYELVAGQLPFVSDDPVKIVSAHLQQQPKPPSTINPGIPSHLNQLILRLLEKSPADRPSSPGEVKEMIGTALTSRFRKVQTGGFSTENTLLSHLSSGTTVGRESEISRMKESVEQTTRNGGKPLWISGEVGIGRTFLLKQLRIECQLQGIVFVDSRCLESRTLAYQPVMEVLRKLEPYVENRCSKDLLDEIRQLLQWSHSDSPLEKDQASFHRRITRLLISASQTSPFVMAIENLQWADLPTLQFLEHLQNGINQGKIFLCCTVCQEKLQTNTQTTDSIHRLLASENSEHLKLDRLDLPGTGVLINSKLIRNRFDPEFINYVYQRTSGNPFFVVEFLKFLLEEGLIYLKRSTWVVDLESLKRSDIPATVEAVLLKNLERYDRKIVDLLKVLAVIGKKFTLRLLNQNDLLEKDTLSETLSLLTQDRLLIRKEPSGKDEIWYEFANQSLQNLLYQQVDQDRRTELHRRVATLLEAEMAGLEDEFIFEIAHHYLKARLPEKAYHYSILCAEKMRQRFAGDQAMEHLGNAIQISSRISNQEEALRKKAEALIKRGALCRKLGELNRAEKDYLTALSLMESSDNLKILAQSYNGLGETYRLKHDYKRGISYLKKAMLIHQELNDPQQLADTISLMGLLYWTDNQYQEALDSFQEALKIDTKLGNKFSMASALNNMGLVFWSRHQYVQALKNFEDSLPVYRELGNKEWIARSLNNIGATLLFLGEYSKATDHILQSLSINEKIENDKECAHNLENLGETFQKMGDYENAIKYNEMGLKLVRRIGLTQREGYLLGNLGLVHLELGKYDEAHTYLKQAQDMAVENDDKALLISTGVNLSMYHLSLNDVPTAELCWEEAARTTSSIIDERSSISILKVESWIKKRKGEYESAFNLLEDALALAKKLNVGDEVFSLTLELAQLFLEKGNLEKSSIYLKIAGDFGLERYILFQPMFYLTSGKIKWINGDMRFAQKDFETALTLAEKINNPEMIWKIHHQLSKLFLTLRDIENAYRELKNAAGILKKLNQYIEDQELKRKYLEDTEKKELLANLKKVAKDLIGETRTA